LSTATEPLGRARQRLAEGAEEVLAEIIPELRIDPETMFRFPAGQNKIDLYAYKYNLPDWAEMRGPTTLDSSSGRSIMRPRTAPLDRQWTRLYALLETSHTFRCVVLLELYIHVQLF